MFGTGCRIGEIIGLRWEDVDFDNRMITIDHNITYYPRSDKSYKSEFRLSLPKTAAGIRTVPMIDEVYEALLDEKHCQDEGTGTDRTILSGIHAFYEPEELVGKTLIAITNLPPRKMMGIDSCGMLLSAIHEEEGEEKLHLLMVDNHIPAGAKLY